MKKKHIYSAITILFLLFAPIVVLTRTAAPGDISGALNQFVGPTGVQQTTLEEATGRTLRVLYQLTGLIFFVLAVYGGILWLTAAGNDETVKKARNILIGATIGLAVIVMAYGITQFITSRAVREFTEGRKAPDPGGGAKDQIACLCTIIGEGSEPTNQTCSIHPVTNAISREPVNFCESICPDGIGTQEGTISPDASC